MDTDIEWQSVSQVRKMYQFLRCGKRSVHDKIPVTCHGPRRIPANRKRGANSKSRWRERFIGRSSSANVVGVCGFRTLIWCRIREVWAASNELGKRLKNSCMSGDSRVAYQLKELKQELSLSNISEELCVTGA